MGYLDKRYVLNVGDTLNILNKYIKPRYGEDVAFSVRQSDESKSIYIELNYKGIGRLIRLSDHPDPNKHLIFHFIGKSTKNSKIVSIVKNQIKKIEIKLAYEKVNGMEK